MTATEPAHRGRDHFPDRRSGNRQSGALRGFTVLELLVALAIAAIVAATAVPSLSAMGKRNRMAAANNEFLSSVYLLRSEAAKRHRIVKMCRRFASDAPACATSGTGGWHAGWIIWVDENSNDQVDGDESPVSVHGGFGNGVVLTGNGSVANRIAFRSTGATSGVSNGTFTVCITGSPRKRQIVISRAGRIRTADLDSDGSC